MAQSRLIEDMLDVSRIISGKLRLDIGLLDLSAIVMAAQQSIQLAAESKSIQILSPTHSVMLVGDRDRLQQVLWNLLSNAVKFTPNGGQITVTVETLQAEAEIRVSDTGKGIPADQIPYVFDRFRQVDSSSSKSGQGLGLGLSIVRHIIELHGGTVRAESPGANQGTTIIARLPLRAVLLEQSASEATNETPLSALESAIEFTVEDINRQTARQDLPSLAGLHILAVDDNVDSLAVMKYVLENIGAEVVIVTSAREALSELSASPDQYDILLADIGMPEEDGFFLIRKIRALNEEAGGQIPAAAVTAYVSNEERQTVINAGFQAHITKPIDFDQLVSIIIRLTT